MRHLRALLNLPGTLLAMWRQRRAEKHQRDILADAQHAFRVVDARMKAAGYTRQQRRQVWNDLVHERRPNLP